jgi:hypothetical protein
MRCASARSRRDGSPTDTQADIHVGLRKKNGFEIQVISENHRGLFGTEVVFGFLFSIFTDEP